MPQIAFGVFSLFAHVLRAMCPSPTANTTAEVDFIANNPRATLFYCHMQSHMDFGFMMLSAAPDPREKENHRSAANVILFVGSGIVKDELKTRGWICLQGVRSTSELLDLARTLGRPIPSPTGELVKELAPIEGREARKGTFSAKYARGCIPLHTDTAFWPLPSKYLLFRSRGDLRRPTTILTFAHLFQNNPDLCSLAERSVWMTRTSASAMYCSMKFCSRGQTGWRYDPHSMRPVNQSAIEVRARIGRLLVYACPECICWTPELALIISNWDALHGRGPSPPMEMTRILERIYVE